MYTARATEENFLYPAIDILNATNPVTGEPYYPIYIQELLQVIKSEDGEWFWHTQHSTAVFATDVDYRANQDSVALFWHIRPSAELWYNYGNGTYGGLGSPPLLELDDVNHTII